MFGKRSDGKQVKGLDGISRLMPLFMPSREGATNKFLLQIDAKHLDDYIEKKKLEGKEYVYRDIIVAVLIRAFKMYPRLNRFISGYRIYDRNSIDMSMNVHKNLRTGTEETVVKTRFTGYETIDEIKSAFESEVAKAMQGNDTDGTADMLAKLPLWLLRLVVSTMRGLDNWGLLSRKFLFEVSPFHTSIYFADLNSIGLDFCYHHLYNFGNCGFFATMGKEKYIPVVDKDTGEVTTKKVIEIGITEDERCVDGLYFSRALKGMRKILKNPALLEQPLQESEIYVVRGQNKAKDKR